MKSALSLVLAILLDICSYGQGRSCDIRANIIYPNPGHTFVSISEQEIKVSLINEGPDTLRHGDDYSVKFRFGGVHLFPSFNSINRYVYPGDSIVFTDTLDINYVGNLDSMPFCTDVLFYNVGRDSIKRETPEQKVNNTHCITTKHARSNVSNRSKLHTPLSVTMFPNPANSSTTVSCFEEIESIQLMQPNGQTVKLFNDVLSNSFEIPLEHLVPGIYILRIQSGQHWFTEKLVYTP